MRRLAILALVVASALITFAADSVQAPVLQWYKTVSGSGNSTVAGVGTDAQGNFYVAGSTASLDLPTVAAAQSHPGGSPLLRINTTSGSSSHLYGPGLAAISSISVDPENSSTLYAVAQQSVSRSTDWGDTWTILTGFPSTTTILSLTIDPMNSNTLYAATNGLGVLKSTDAGATWTAINNGIPTYYAGTNQIAAVQIFIDPNSPAFVFCFVDTNSFSNLYRSTDHGASWSPTTLGPNPGPLSFDPFTTGTVYAPGSRSTDDGQTWAPFFPGYSVLPDPLHPGTLFGFGNSGLYQSTDSGVTWNLKINSSVYVLAADPKQPVLYAIVGNAVVRTTDGFNTYSVFGPSRTVSGSQLLVAGSFLYEVESPSSDVFVAKLDPNGNVVYSTYFGGNGDDTAAGMAVGKDGSVYVTGQTHSPDFPVTAGAYATSISAGITGSSFVFKLNPDGSLAWSTFFNSSGQFGLNPSAIAVDASGSPYISGFTYGGLPITPGAYQAQPDPPALCASKFGFVLCTSPTGFLTKFSPQGSALVFSTYTGQYWRGLVVDPNGNAYVGGIGLINATGSSVLNSINYRVTPMALDASGNLYATVDEPRTLVPTPGAFQTSPSPRAPFGDVDPLVVKFSGNLKHVLAATLLGGSENDAVTGIAIDPSTGNVIVSGSTNSLDFPTGVTFQGPFGAPAGFVAGFDSNLSQLLFSTYLGSEPFFALGAFPDRGGNILLAGTTFPVNAGGDAVIVNKIALEPAPAVRLAAVVNAASQLRQPLAPGENVALIGAGFGPDTQVFLDGVPLPVVSVSQNQVIADMPTDAPTSGARQLMASSGGTNSNTVHMPSATVSPAIYSVNGTGFGQGYILNADGTLNSPSNPAAAGDPITIFATGVGQISTVNGYAVTALPVSVFVDGVYANGIAAVVKQVPGLPGNVYEIGVFVPDQLYTPGPHQAPIALVLGGVSSQPGITLSVK